VRNCAGGIEQFAGDEMQRVTVYHVRLYDHHIGAVSVSTRMATEEGAKVMGGQIVPDSGLEVDAGLLEKGEQWTRLNFDPDRV
jgi:hypothetical protein